jgi:hypothetical protein
MNVTSNNRVRFGLGSILVEIELVEIRTRLIIRHKEHMSQCQRIQLDLKLNTSRIKIVREMNVSYMYIVSWYHPRLQFELLESDAL